MGVESLMSKWLVKSELSVYSIADLRKDNSTAWDGVRNYQARNNLKAMKIGDEVLFYHSVDDPIGIAGLAKVSKTAYPEPLQFNKKSEYFEPAATKDNPRWFCPEIEFVSQFKQVLSLESLKKEKKLAGMVLLQKGSRLSVQPVNDKHFEHILSLAAY